MGKNPALTKKHTCTHACMHTYILDSGDQIKK